jgi:hypothetical protein
MTMNTQNIEIDLLSDDELDDVAGARVNLDNDAVVTCLSAFCGAAGPAGAKYFLDKVEICAH